MRVAGRSFPLNDGRCVIHHDRLELEYGGLHGMWLRWANARRLTSVGFWYFIGALGFLLAALLSVIINNWFLAFFFLLFTGMSTVASWVNRQASLRILIEKKDIRSVEFHEAVEGVSRAYFRVFFAPSRHLRMRKLLLPSKLKQGTQVANAAYWIMKEEGLMS